MSSNEEHYVVVLKNGKACEFEGKVTKISELCPGVLMFSDSYNRQIAAIPKENIWTIFYSGFENRNSFYI